MWQWLLAKVERIEEKRREESGGDAGHDGDILISVLKQNDFFRGCEIYLDGFGYDTESATMIANPQHPARVWLQQIWVEGKWRSLFITVGQKDINPGFVNRSLSSGDLVMSGNARAPFGARAGFINFQNVPFTRGWLQIKGEYGFYRLADTHWLENHYNYYNSFITTHYWFNYKNIHLRTNPTKPLVLTIGAQASCQFAGTANYYDKGNITQHVKMKANFKAFWHTLFAGSGGENQGDKIYVQGNHVGSWDIALDYNMPSGATLRAYYQSLWEDGSGIGKQNGFDGLWGIEYRSGKHDAAQQGIGDTWRTAAAAGYLAGCLRVDRHTHGALTTI